MDIGLIISLVANIVLIGILGIVLSKTSNFINSMKNEQMEEMADIEARNSRAEILYRKNITDLQDSFNSLVGTNASNKRWKETFKKKLDIATKEVEDLLIERRSLKDQLKAVRIGNSGSTGVKINSKKKK